MFQFNLPHQFPKTRRGLFGLVPAIAATAALPAAAGKLPRNIDAEISHHIEQIQLLQMMKHPHIKAWDRIDVNCPDAEGCGSIMLVARRAA